MKNLLKSALLALAAVVSINASAQTVGVGSLAPGSVSYPTGAAIAKVTSENSNLRASVQPASGMDALIKSIDAGKLEFAVVAIEFADDAVHGRNAFSAPIKNLQVASVLMPTRLAMLVRADSGINTIADLKGKRVAHGFVAQQGTADATNALLANGGLSENDVVKVPVPSVRRGAEELAAGNVDATILAVGAAAATEVASKTGGVRVLAVDPSDKGVAAIRQFHPNSSATVVQPRVGLTGIAEPTAVLEYDQLLVTGPTVDEQTVYLTVKAMHEKHADLVNTSAAFKGMDPQKMYKNSLPLAYHPGALRYYKEIGLVK